MPSKTRAQLLVEELQARMPKADTESTKSNVRTVKQADKAGMDALEKRRVALKKLHDFKDGVL
jgi:hypothetical protein